MPRFLRSAVLPLCLLLVGATALLLVQSRQEAVERAREITERTGDEQESPAVGSPLERGCAWTDASKVTGCEEGGEMWIESDKLDFEFSCAAVANDKSECLSVGRERC